MVTATGVAHDGDKGTCHTGIARTGGVGQDVREGVVAHELLHLAIAKQTAKAVAVIAGKGLLGSGFVQLGGIKDEAYLVQGCGGGKVVHLAQGELNGIALLFLCGGGAIVQQHGIVLLHKDKRGVAASDDGGGLLLASLAGDLNV